MSLVDSLKQFSSAEERIVYRCEACGETFDVGTDAESPSCPACGSDELAEINRV